MSADHPTTLTTRVANRAPGSRSGRRYLPEVDGHPVQALDPLLDGGCDANNSGGPIWQPIIFFGLAIVLAWRWRDFETSPSFPSGHTIEAFVIATMLTYLLVRHLWDRSAAVKVLIGVVAFVYACAMGFSRVFLGYHWLTDVFAAAMLGVAWAGVVIAMHRVWRMVRKRRERGPVEEETVTRTELS